MPSTFDSVRAALRAARTQPLFRDTPAQRALRSQWVNQVQRILRAAENAGRRGVRVDMSNLDIRPPKVYTRRGVANLSSYRLVYSTPQRVGATFGRFANERQRKLASEWRKEAKRIRRQARRMEARGYTVDLERLRLDEPKVFTRRSVNRLKGIDTDRLYGVSRWTDPETGEVMAGNRARKMERSRAARKAAQTRRERQRERDEVEAPPEGPEGDTPPEEPEEPEVPEEPEGPDEPDERERRDETPPEEEPPHPPDWPDVVIDSFTRELVDGYFDKVRDLWVEWLADVMSRGGKEAAAEVLEEMAERGMLDRDNIYQGPYEKGFATAATSFLVGRGYLTSDQRDEMLQAIEDSRGFETYDDEDPVYSQMTGGRTR